MADDVRVFEQYGPCRWICQGDDVTWPVKRITESGGNRIVEHKRPFREGAKLDDTGGEPFVWKLDAVFNNTLDEDGLRADEPIYPDLLNRLIRSLSIHKTGSLYLPTRGAVRARPRGWERVETDEVRDEGAFTVTFVEDNEDAVDRAALKEPSVSAQLVRLAEQAEFTAAQAGTLTLGALKEFCEDLQNLAQAPGRAIDDVTRAAEVVKHTTRKLIRTLRQESERVSQFVFAPHESELARQLEALLDLASAAELQRNASRGGTTRTMVVQADTDIYALAAGLRIDAAVLLDLNYLPDPLHISAGTKLRIPVAPGGSLAA